MTEQGVAVLDLADWQLGLNIVLVTQPSGDVCHTKAVETYWKLCKKVCYFHPKEGSFCQNNMFAKKKLHTCITKILKKSSAISPHHLSNSISVIPIFLWSPTKSWTCLLGKTKKPSPHFFNITVEYNGNNQDTLIATSIVAGGYFLIGLIRGGSNSKFWDEFICSLRRIELTFLLVLSFLSCCSNSMMYLMESRSTLPSEINQSSTVRNMRSQKAQSILMRKKISYQKKMFSKYQRDCMSIRNQNQLIRNPVCS